MKRLLISGTKNNENTLSAFFLEHLKKEPALEIELLSFHDRFRDASRRFFYKIFSRLFPAIARVTMDRDFMQQAERFQPDVIVVFKGSEITKRSLIKLRNKGIRLVNYNFDHPFQFFSKGSGNRFVSEAIPYYHTHITYSHRIAAELRERFHVDVDVLPFGYALSDSDYEKVVSAPQTEKLRACLVGNPDQWRTEYLRQLLDAGVPVDVFGFGWDAVRELQGLPGLVIHPPAHPIMYWKDKADLWRTLREYRIQLNFFRPHNEGSHNLRTFEVPAVGGILLTPFSQEQAGYFENGKEVFFYRDASELIAQCRRLLSMSADEINTVRHHARNRSVSSGYSYEHRTKQLLNIIFA